MLASNRWFSVSSGSVSLSAQLLSSIQTVAFQLHPDARRVLIAWQAASNVDDSKLIPPSLAITSSALRSTALRSPSALVAQASQLPRSQHPLLQYLPSINSGVGCLQVAQLAHLAFQAAAPKKKISGNAPRAQAQEKIDATARFFLDGCTLAQLAANLGRVCDELHIDVPRDICLRQLMPSGKESNQHVVGTAAALVQSVLLHEHFASDVPRGGRLSSDAETVLTLAMLVCACQVLDFSVYFPLSCILVRVELVIFRSSSSTGLVFHVRSCTAHVGVCV